MGWQVLPAPFEIERGDPAVEPHQQSRTEINGERSQKWPGWESELH